MDDRERGQAAAEDLQTQAKLTLGVSLSGIGLGSVDYMADTVTLDEIAAQLFDLPARTPLSRKAMHDRFYPDDAARMQSIIEKHLDPSSVSAMTAEHRVIHRNGKIWWLAVRKQVVFSATEPNGYRRPVTGLFAIRDISDRKFAEERLRISETRYRRLFEAAHDGVLLLDPVTAKIVDANPFMTRLLGYSRAELIGKELFEIGLLSDSAASQEMFEKLTHTHEVRYENLPLKSQDGSDRDVEVVANLYDEGGHSIIQCNIRDITQRRLLEATIFQNSQLFSTLIEQAPTGVYVIDQDFRILQVNQPAMPLFEHITPLIGRDFSEILNINWGADTAAPLEAIFRQSLATGKPYIAPPFTATRHDIKVEQSYEWEIQRVTLADGKYGIVCYFKDVTARRIAEVVIAEREGRIRSILDNTQAFIGLLNTDGTILEANISALSAAVARRELVIGKKIWSAEWWTNDVSGAARLQDAVERCANGEIIRYDMSLRLRDDTHIDVDFMLAPVRDASGAVVLLVPSALDITDRKKSLEQVELLMGEVNHRAMNLLSVVLAVARQTMRSGDPATLVTRLTDRIIGLAASHDLLVQNEWRGVDVGDLVRAQLAHYKGLFGSKILIAGPPARLTAAAAQGIGMALHELATNAGKHGSLSTVAGRVGVSWLINGRPEVFQIHWRESGGPKVVVPTRRGFGQKVIGPMVEAAVNGSAVVDYASSGFSWTLTAPASDTLEKERENAFVAHAS